jgi:hypothetical protein
VPRAQEVQERLSARHCGHEAKLVEIGIGNDVLRLRAEGRAHALHAEGGIVVRRHGAPGALGLVRGGDRYLPAEEVVLKADVVVDIEPGLVRVQVQEFTGFLLRVTELVV